MKLELSIEEHFNSATNEVRYAVILENGNIMDNECWVFDNLEQAKEHAAYVKHTLENTYKLLNIVNIGESRNETAH